MQSIVRREKPDLRDVGYVLQGFMALFAQIGIATTLLELAATSIGEGILAGGAQASRSSSTSWLVVSGWTASDEELRMLGS